MKPDGRSFTPNDMQLRLYREAHQPASGAAKIAAAAADWATVHQAELLALAKVAMDGLMVSRNGSDAMAASLRAAADGLPPDAREWLDRLPSLRVLRDAELQEPRALLEALTSLATLGQGLHTAAPGHYHTHRE